VSGVVSLLSVCGIIEYWLPWSKFLYQFASPNTYMCRCLLHVLCFYVDEFRLFWMIFIGIHPQMLHSLVSAQSVHNSCALILSCWYLSVISYLYIIICFNLIWNFVQGLANRRTGSTSANADSSRSHCVFTCVIKSESKVAVEFGLITLKFHQSYLFCAVILPAVHVIRCCYLSLFTASAMPSYICSLIYLF
jgi:hypothetical protein